MSWEKKYWHNDKQLYGFKFNYLLNLLKHVELEKQNESVEWYGLKWQDTNHIDKK